ncbi:MAG: alpha/beta fold hydrolase [Candidatus Binatia bacterium]
MTAPATWRSLHLDGVIHAFTRDGKGDPVVLLHGAGGNALALRTIAAAFGERPLLLLDMPGHGLSPAPASWDLDDTTALVTDAAQRRFGNVPAIWGGHSWGGKVAGLVAARNPAACRGLVLVDPSPSAAVPIEIGTFVDSTWGAEMEAQTSAEDALRAAATQRHWQPWDEESAEAARHGLSRKSDGTWSLAPTRAQLLALCTAVLHVDAGEALAAAKAVPTLLLVAEESLPWQQMTNFVVYAEAARAVIPGHHWIHHCNREAVRAAIADWLAALDEKT